jgi:hypothetical protein
MAGTPLPGDIVVTPFHGGYLVLRAGESDLKSIYLGADWAREYAISRGEQHTREIGVALWYNEGGFRFERLSAHHS